MIEPPVGSAPAAPRRGAPGVDPFTSMIGRFGRLARWFGSRFFRGFRFEPGDAERLRALEAGGALVYVMRYSSRLDYFLFNWLFLSERVRLAGFANGIRFYYYRPVLEALQLLLRVGLARLRRGRSGMRARGIAHARATLRAGGTMFLFLRTDKIGSRLRATRRGALVTGRSELDYLNEVVVTAFEEELPVSLVPLVLFWRKGPRRRRFLNVFYGAPERPSDTGKVLSFLWNYHNLAVRVGTPIDLRRFVDERRAEGRGAVVKKVRRSLLIFLRREEKPIAGAALRPIEQTEQLVLSDPDVSTAVEAEVARSRHSRSRIERRARRQLREIAAHPSSSMLAVLDVLVTRAFGRLFDAIEVRGLERVVEAAKLHPLVLVPCHRSHVDYLMLSWLIYERHLVPPLVAAGVNLAFWPLGPIFRRAGGFFLRRGFEGDRLYATVFRCYVQQLIKDGLTQEFFIEGTRSRTGRTLPPRLGMLAMILEAYRRGVRRDVQLVPIGLTYERLLEERSMTEERRGAAKARENVAALFRARSVLRRRLGTVAVHFGEPISLAELLGPPGEPARREATELLGIEISRRLNRLICASRTSLPAAVLLASRGRGVRQEDLVLRARELVALLELLDVPIAEALAKDLPRDLEASMALLQESGLVARSEDRRGVIVAVEPDARDVLDYYRGGLAPALALPGALALALVDRQTRKDTCAGAGEWLDLLRLEYFPPLGEERDWRFARLLDHFRLRGWTDESAEDGLRATPAGSFWLELFRAQILPTVHAYAALFETVAEAGGEGERGDWLRDARESIQRALLLGEADFPEADNGGALDNALALLVADGILVCDGTLRGDDARLRPGPRFEQLRGRSDRLAGALGSR